MATDLARMIPSPHQLLQNIPTCCMAAALAAEAVDKVSCFLLLGASRETTWEGRGGGHKGRSIGPNPATLASPTSLPPTPTPPTPYPHLLTASRSPHPKCCTELLHDPVSDALELGPDDVGGDGPGGPRGSGLDLRERYGEVWGGMGSPVCNLSCGILT